MPLGTIKKLFVDKHCGFLAAASGGPDVFFHGTVVTGNEFRSLIVGQRVEFELDESGENERGPRASRVRPFGGGPPAATPQEGEFRPLRRHRAARAKKPTWRNKPQG
ncbi:MAG TPA: cold shock domain-containing protein [Pirellulales bacterium]|nr:cold shock domain-containing protein [Pirellulales bacterium]